MSHRSTIGVSQRGLRLALAVLAALVCAEADARAAKLQWKFKPGETLHYQVDQKTVRIMKPNGMEVKTTLTQTIDLTWNVKNVSADGTADLTMTNDRFRTKVESPFGKFEYDSADKKEPEGQAVAQMVKTIKALVGAEFKFKMNPQGEISAIQVPESLLKSLKESDPSAVNAGMFSEEGLKNMVTETSFTLPARDLSAGKTWSTKTKAPLGPGAALMSDKTYTYEGPEAKSDKIVLSAKTTLEATPIPNVELKLVGSDVKGTYLFDNDKGRIASSDVYQKIEIHIKAMGMEDTQSTEISNVMTLVDGKSTGASK